MPASAAAPLGLDGSWPHPDAVHHRHYSPDVELVGRRTELGAIRLALERTSAGRRTVVVVEGEAGIGKTSLLTALRAEATRREAVVLTTSVTPSKPPSDGLAWPRF
jgi:chromosomal replication initiation ATPase DnaA